MTPQQGEDAEQVQDLRVVLVDDDEAVARVCGRVLQRLGHRVETFTRPELALERVTIDPADFDVVITDHRMPGMTGQELLERMYDAGVVKPALLVSGHADEIDRSRLATFGVGPALDKPFSRDDMQARLTEIMIRFGNRRDPSGAG